MGSTLQRPREERIVLVLVRYMRRRFAQLPYSGDLLTAFSARQKVHLGKG
jgi:hypothetical protein